MTNEKALRKTLREIAGFYGCKVRFAKSTASYWDGDTIILGQADSRRVQLSLFFHELAHFVNWKTGRFPIYHNPKNFGRMRRFFPHYKQLVRYSLQAEVFTEKVGKELMSFWFPNMKYRTYYRNTAACYEFLYGYYLDRQSA